MRKFVFVLICGLAFSVHTAQEKNVSKVETIFNRYLALNHPKGPSKTDAYDPVVSAEMSRARMARLAVLAELRSFPKDAVLAAREVLFKQANSKQRLEIVAMLGDDIHTRQCADLLHDVIQDVRETGDGDAAIYEELVRCSAVHGLRRMGRRIDRRGGVRTGQVFEPKVSGLTPYMIAAAKDTSERVRISATYALADSLDPAAVPVFLDLLKDPSQKVRLYAACFLTEHQNVAGLLEMQNALNRFIKTDKVEPEEEFRHYIMIELLITSFERITGKTFGQIPLNPTLSSSVNSGEKEQYDELLNTWHAWWTWQPDDLQLK